MNTPPWRTKINIHANGFRHDERALGPGFCINTHKNRGSVPLSSGAGIAQWLEHRTRD